MSSQSGILAPVPNASTYMEFRLRPTCDPQEVLRKLCELEIGEGYVIGFGRPLMLKLNKDCKKLATFPALSGPGIAIPSTQNDIWVWVRGDCHSDTFERSKAICKILEPAFDLDSKLNGFKYDTGRDLSGYEDGTENPEDDDAVEAAIDETGASYVAVQKWLHNLKAFHSLDQKTCDDIIGRRLSDNEELDDAPPSAHTQRTEQESFDPELFVVRRSVPWTEGRDEGLVFVAFGHSHNAYETILNRMIGLEDGITDSLFTFSRPLTGGYYYCPPIKNNRLDFSF